MNSPKEIIGRHIKKIRTQKGFSGVELADMLLCSQQHISRIERGLVRLNMEQIQQIADCLNVEMSTLLDGVGFQDDPLKRMLNMDCYFQAEKSFITSGIL